ncbi:MAG: 2-hydroxymuconate tautomerase [Bacillota bacterium]|jgi:4-oxalocrotonate tautomerase
MVWEPGAAGSKQPLHSRRVKNVPIVQMEILKGRTVEQKRAMVKEVTDAICRTLNAPPEAVSIIIRDMEFDNYAKAGVLRSDQQK